MRRAASVLLLLVSPAWADPPRAVLSGPETAALGDLVVISAEGSTAEAYSWELNADKSFLPVDGGVRVVFASGTPGVYRFTLTVATVDDGKPRMHSARHTVLIRSGPGPDPGPKPPVPPDPPEPPTPPLPDGDLGLIKASREGMASVNLAADAKAEQAKRLAAAQRSLASAIGAGALKEPAKILDAWRAGNNAAVNSAAWAPWGQAMTRRLGELIGDRKLTAPSEWQAAFEEIALGLGG